MNSPKSEKTSGRGGRRAKGGRPSNWRNGRTVTIRVPEIFAEKLMEVAKELDKGLDELLTINPQDLKLARHSSQQERTDLFLVRTYSRAKRKTFDAQDLVQALQALMSKD